MGFVKQNPVQNHLDSGVPSPFSVECSDERACEKNYLKLQPRYDIAITFPSERRKPMIQWDLALRVFAFGLTGVFATLALLMVSMFISGLIIRKSAKGKNQQ